jgi:hypothetical protein
MFRIFVIKWYFLFVSSRFAGLDILLKTSALNYIISFDGCDVLTTSFNNCLSLIALNDGYGHPYFTS